MIDPAHCLLAVRRETRLVAYMTDRLLVQIGSYPIGAADRTDRIVALSYLKVHQITLKGHEADARRDLFRELSSSSSPNPLSEPTQAEIEEFLAGADETRPAHVGGHVHVLCDSLGRYGEGAAPLLTVKLKKILADAE